MPPLTAEPHSPADPVTLLEVGCPDSCHSSIFFPASIILLILLKVHEMVLIVYVTQLPVITLEPLRAWQIIVLNSKANEPKMADGEALAHRSLDGFF